MADVGERPCGVGGRLEIGAWPSPIATPSFHFAAQGMRPRPLGSPALASRGRARREFRGDEIRRQASERRRREIMRVSGRLPNFPWR